MRLLRETVIDNPYIPHEINGFRFPSVPQAYFLTLPVQEALYGGAAGGGKSAALLAAALQFVHVPGYSAILLRRTLTDLELEGSLIPMSHDWLSGTDAEWDGQLHQWRFPSGAVVAFGYLKGEQDHFRYKSAAFQTVGFDELTSFKEHQYRFLFGRLRKPANMQVPLRCLSASNPGDVGHEWVKTRFQPQLSRDKRNTPGREFVPARLEDNPGLDKPSYEKMLDELDPVTRAQMRSGDWGVRPEGNMFKREWFSGRYADDAPKNIARRVRFWDLAATEAAPGKDPDFTAGVLMSIDRQGMFWIEDVQEFRATPADNEVKIGAAASADGRAVEVYIEQEPGASGKSLISHYQRNVLPGYSVYGVKSTGDKITRAKPFSAACQNGLVRVLRGSWLAKLLDRLTGFGLPGVHDDVADAAAGAHRQLTTDSEPWTEGDMQRAFDGPAHSLDAIEQTEEMSFEDRILARMGDSENSFGGGTEI